MLLEMIMYGTSAAGRCMRPLVILLPHLIGFEVHKPIMLASKASWLIFLTYLVTLTTNVFLGKNVKNQGPLCI